MRTLLIDGDILIYKIASQNEEPTHWGDGLWTLHCDEKICKAEVDKQIQELLDNLEADKFIIALTDKKNFRKDILPSYKDNRKQKRKPLALPFLRQYCIEKYEAVIMDSLEADDVLGILATEPSNEERIIVSIDKDLYQIPGKISKDGKTFEEISENEANYWHMMQTLYRRQHRWLFRLSGNRCQDCTESIRRPRKCSPLRPMDASSSSLRQSWLLN